VGLGRQVVGGIADSHRRAEEAEKTLEEERRGLEMEKMMLRKREEKVSRWRGRDREGWR
jgi:hypothetical protein